MDITQIIRIISQPEKTIAELITELGYTGSNTIHAKLLNWIVDVCPEYSIIYDILYHYPDDCELKAVRDSNFVEAIRKRDGVCWITG